VKELQELRVLHRTLQWLSLLELWAHFRATFASEKEIWQRSMIVLGMKHSCVLRAFNSAENNTKIITTHHHKGHT
jgi:hypothetical protein